MKDASEPTSKAQLRLWLRLLKVNRLIEAELRERLRTQFSTTLPRFDVMSALYRNPEGLKMSQLSRMLMVSNGNVTGIVDRLREDGFLVREAVPGDRRAARVKLSESGKTEFENQAAAHEAWVNELMAQLSAEDCARIADMLGKTLTQEHLQDAN